MLGHRGMFNTSATEWVANAAGYSDWTSFDEPISLADSDSGWKFGESWTTLQGKYTSRLKDGSKSMSIQDGAQTTVAGAVAEFMFTGSCYRCPLPSY